MSLGTHPSHGSCSGESGGMRAVARCGLLAAPPYSQDETGLFRPYLSAAHKATLATVALWMQQAGMSVRQDAAGNIIGRYEGIRPHAPALLIGSHLDSVRNAGSYDGPLGVMLGLECVAYFAACKKRFPFALEVIGFGDEEGSRFPVSMLTSRAVAGLLPHAPQDMVDTQGVSLSQALEQFGLSLRNFVQAARSPQDIVAYLEAHIEQGPVLEAKGKAVGVVTGIAAQYRFLVRITGFAGHAGTMPMSMRQDALAAAAEAILIIEQTAQQGAQDLVATVGSLSVAPGAPNVVPGEVSFTLDVRAGTEAVRNAAVEQIRMALAALARRRAVTVDIVQQQDLASAPCDEALIQHLGDAVRQVTQEPARQLVSGAGHDAMVMAALAPMCMLFVRCEKGISHNPAEAVNSADVETALQVMVRFIENYAGSFETKTEQMAG
ncbi:allantoate amidohydrolase [Acetobacter orientalis]|uniref:allantoate amidohydrolase n=1 Tax=Acetobacter orientalis TaxID=146474 RepID=UPI0020A11261|nr:allantoate amidohydrolase [Acetobacter orientalis]MCP1217126.1 allantoate amidohydrolase [Acetobacter orientalis]MCP1220021.1 allantoate amidohydrolase [Acetobacter orientalis]